MDSSMLSSVKDRLRRYSWYTLLAKVKQALQQGIKDLNSPNAQVVSLKPVKSSQGNVLLSYFLEPFLLEPGQAIPDDHTRYWESVQIAKTFLDLGYSVDVIDETNQIFVPTKNYSLFVGHWLNSARIAQLLNKDCVKVLHIDQAHVLFFNAAVSRRLLELQQRKGCTLRFIRLEPTLAIEHADCATILGNEFTISTYSYANKPIYRIPISTPVVYPWPEGKDFEACRKRYVWFGNGFGGTRGGGGGFVRKGLDLVLEAFAEMPEYHLTVCGPVNGEHDFERAYYKELYQSSNIDMIGWVDVSSAKFIEILNHSIGVVFPSCCEGQCGGVVTCLHGGLIPIISYESGVDIGDFGLMLKGCSIDEIKNAIRRISSLPLQELKRMARSAWEFARANHTKDRFAEEYRKAIIDILATYAKRDAIAAEEVEHENSDTRLKRIESRASKEGNREGITTHLLFSFSFAVQNVLVLF
jgi:glycosyltransferase involved in cell wall biosynthesis